MLHAYMTITPIINGIVQKGTYGDQKVYPFQDLESANNLINYFKQHEQCAFLLKLDDMVVENPDEPYSGIIKNLDCGYSNLTVDLMINFDKSYYLPQNNGYIVGIIDCSNSKLILHDLDGRIYDFNLNH
jgi:hypothetical protein